MSKLSDAHLYPFTMAFKEAVDNGTISLDNAQEFCDRVFSAYLEACVARKERSIRDRHTNNLLPITVETLGKAGRGRGAVE